MIINYVAIHKAKGSKSSILKRYVLFSYIYKFIQYEISTFALIQHADSIMHYPNIMCITYLMLTTTICLLCNYYVFQNGLTVH